MPGQIRFASRNLSLLALVIIAFSIRPAGVLADFEPVTNLNPDTGRLLEKKQELENQKEKITAEDDRLYNEITTQNEPGFLEQHAWNLITLAFVLLVIVRLILYRRGKEYAPVSVSGRRLSSADGAELDLNLASSEHRSNHSFLTALFSFLRGSSRRRHRSRSRHHRHGHRHRSRY